MPSTFRRGHFFCLILQLSAMRFKFSWKQVGENVISQARCREVGGYILYATNTRIGCGIMPPEKALRCFPLTGLYGSTAEKPPTGRFFWVLLIGRLSGTFSLTKSSPICKRHFSCRFSLQKAPDDKGVSSSAELDQQALPAGHPLPFEKEAKLY